TVPAAADFAAADPGSDLRNNGIQADLVVIAHPSAVDLLADGSPVPGTPLANLLQRRATQGITSKVVLLQDVQDQFNDGLAGPLAIKSFLTWVLSTQPGEGWASPKPSYVMLIGDGSYDYKAGLPNGNFVPTQMMYKDSPELGYYSSDNLLAA